MIPITDIALLFSDRDAEKVGFINFEKERANERYNKSLTLIDFGEAMPALPLGHPFTNMQTDLLPDDYYWSSITYRSYNYGAWVLRMFDGYANGHYKTGNYYVWPVRGGQ